MTRLLIAAPRWIFLALLVFAPWAYGSTRPWTVDVVNRAMLLILILWLIGCAVRRLGPKVPRALWASAVFLFLQGWWLNVNAQSYYDDETFQFVPVPMLLSFAPGSVDRWESVPIMIRITGLLGMICFIADLSWREVWRRRLWWTIGLTGSSLILYGLIQRILGAPMIFWETGRTGATFFATYFYHGNAGAFINLVLPPIAGLLLLAFRSREGELQKAIWLPALLISLAGAVAAASKAAIVITLLMGVIFVIWRSHSLVQAWRDTALPAIRWLAVIAVLLLLLGLGWFGWDRMQHRWAEESWVPYSFALRLLTYQTGWSMLSDAGAWGFGPGTFEITFPHYTSALGNKLEGIWQFAHEDYLQTLIEWGWVGGAVWTVPFLGGIFVGVRSYRRRGATFTTSDRILLFTSLVALGGVALHATMDFPLQIASLQLYAATYLGLAWGSASWPSRPA